METIKTKKKKVIKEEVEIYKTFDGKEFSSKKDCARYELAHKYNLQKISTHTDYYEFYTVQNIDELKEMILLEKNCDDFGVLLVAINGTFYKNFSAIDNTILKMQFPITLARTSDRESDWGGVVSYMSLENVIAEKKQRIKVLEETISELNKIKGE